MCLLFGGCEHILKCDIAKQTGMECSSTSSVDKWAGNLRERLCPPCVSPDKHTKLFGINSDYFTGGKKRPRSSSQKDDEVFEKGKRRRKNTEKRRDTPLGKEFQKACQKAHMKIATTGKAPIPNKVETYEMVNDGSESISDPMDVDPPSPEIPPALRYEYEGFSWINVMQDVVYPNKEAAKTYNDLIARTRKLAVRDRLYPSKEERERIASMRHNEWYYLTHDIREQFEKRWADLEFLTKDEKLFYLTASKPHNKRPVEIPGDDNLCGLHAVKKSLISELKHREPNWLMPDILQGAPDDVSKLQELMNHPSYLFEIRKRFCAESKMDWRGATKTYHPGWNRHEKRVLLKHNYSPLGQNFGLADLKLLVRYLSVKTMSKDQFLTPALPRNYRLCAAHRTEGGDLVFNVNEIQSAHHIPIWIDHRWWDEGKMLGHWEGVVCQEDEDYVPGYGKDEWTAKLATIQKKVDLFAPMPFVSVDGEVSKRDLEAFARETDKDSYPSPGPTPGKRSKSGSRKPPGSPSGSSPDSPNGSPPGKSPSKPRSPPTSQPKKSSPGKLPGSSPRSSPRSAPAETPVRPPAEVDENGNVEWVVEAIVGHRDNGRGSRKRREYNVRWLGYKGEDTWEPMRNLANAKEIVDDYERALIDKSTAATTSAKTLKTPPRSSPTKPTGSTPSSAPAKIVDEDTRAILAVLGDDLNTAAAERSTAATTSGKTARTPPRSSLSKPDSTTLIEDRSAEDKIFEDFDALPFDQLHRYLARDYIKLTNRLFGPKRTPGDWDRCGLHAFRLGFYALLESEKHEVPDMFRDQDLRGLMGIIMSTEYRNLCRQLIRIPNRRSGKWTDAELNDPVTGPKIREHFTTNISAGCYSLFTYEDLAMLLKRICQMTKRYTSQPLIKFPIAIACTVRNPLNGGFFISVNPSVQKISSRHRLLWLNNDARGRGHWEWVSKFANSEDNEFLWAENKKIIAKQFNLDPNLK